MSYWRRIIQARLDLVRAADTGATDDASRTSRNIFAESRVGADPRRALITIVPIDDMPPLPDLGAVWAREPIPGDDEHNAL